ncbi:MAG: hypothetical protein KBF23_04270 [Agitococcus sp.]|jgi:hypothetical protein|nr:hypothetical protein [Moraxellaceae bacterium]MBP9216363.1 hypothetical protein [Agitococcus sp.]MBK7300386.1 hypothetical protein [Moraxellaceae bacterium]MBK8326568.1 hypothetical protein [Moraxellaceae bacterium]MBK9186045.1 hypothetical protein [Moraxellaceae bacterium]
MTMVSLSPVDAKQIHQQILQLETLHHDLLAIDSVKANTVATTIKLLHHIEDELRQRARVEHQN